MPIVLARVDERLVHGQIVTSWSKHLRINEIYIIDDEIAQDSFMKEVLKLSSPSGLDFTILSVDEASTTLVNTPSDRRIMLLFKNVSTVLELVEKGYELESINLGNIGSSPNRRRISKNISLSTREEEATKKLVSLGIDVYLQMLYTDSKVDVSDLI